jgi:hypothetical protein
MSRPRFIRRRLVAEMRHAIAVVAIASHVATGAAKRKDFRGQ